jgi:hypothetical protein
MVDQVDHRVLDQFPDKSEMLINVHLYLLYEMVDIEHHHDQQIRYDHHELKVNIKNSKNEYLFDRTMLMTVKINN